MPYNYNLTMMMESTFSFLSSYIIIFLVKGKISKSISFFLSHIVPKHSVGQSDCRISNQIYLYNKAMKQSTFLHVDTRNYELIEKHWGWLWPLWSQGEWMNELSWFFACSHMVSGKVKVTLGMHIIKYGCNLLGPGTLKSASSQE